jgi:hypothetical protein
MKEGMALQTAADKAFKRAEEIFAKYPIVQASHAVKGCSIRGGDTAFERPTCWSYSTLTENKAEAAAAAFRREQEGGIA